MLICKPGNNATFINFDLRFAVKLAKLHSNGDEVSFADFSAAMTVMNNSAIDDSKRNSNLPYFSSSAEVSNLTDKPTTNDYIKTIKDGPFASVIRQMNRPKSDHTVTSNTIHRDTASTSTYSTRESLSIQGAIELKRKLDAKRLGSTDIDRIIMHHMGLLD